MGLVQCLAAVLMLSTQSGLTFPQGDQYYSNNCKMCPAGEYLKSCMECKPCSTGSYTAQLNREDSCLPCFRDCRSELHLKEVQPCTSTSDKKCVCEAGFKCIDTVPFSTNCRECVKIQEMTITEATTIIIGKDKHTPSSASSGHSNTTAEPCRFPKCVSQPGPQAGNGTHLITEKPSSRQAAIFCPLVVMGCIALVILFFVRCSRNESSFKQAIEKLCNEGCKDGSHKPKEPAHQFPRDSFSAKQQPSPLSAANLGPVHVHNPGTVIFSLLSQFTGQVGPTIEGVKTAERGNSEEEDERDCPVFHSTSSPSIHLSEQERSGEIDSIFFPSQEEGKDCHVSKEEAL
ncbi:tumor necrosis factor receptor superfamily member 1A [Pempheris klunzingeri]|uniref:tumor necrosis factor receptor superfamily member 1A n=1 Tax=Pempheris klunzingeri TaxID=3127111 RepID=UPI00397E924D